MTTITLVDSGNGYFTGSDAQSNEIIRYTPSANHKYIIYNTDGTEMANGNGTMIDGDHDNISIDQYGTVEFLGNSVYEYTIGSGVVETPENIDVDSGLVDVDTVTNIEKALAEAFKFKGDEFEMDGDRVVGIKQSFIDAKIASATVDLTHIVNTSIQTITLKATNATINQKLTADSVDVGAGGLTILDTNTSHPHLLKFKAPVA